MIEAAPDAEGNFVARGVAPGRYKVVVSGLPTTHHIGTAVFGGVDAADRQLVIDRRKIQLPDPIKTLGDHAVPVRLHREVVATVTVKVVAEDTQATS